MVVCIDAGPSAGLHNHVVTGGDVFAHGAGGEPDPVFVRLDLLWYADAHLAFILCA
jgi:hypothetical protein